MAVETPLPPIRPLPEFASILKQQEEFGRGAGDTASDQINSWFDKLYLQSGLDLAPSMILAVSVFCAVACGGVVFVIQENLLSTALVTLVGFALPTVGALVARARRQKVLLDQMPPMVEELARAARTGRSIEQCLQLVAADTPAPLGAELQRSIQKMDLGLSLPESLRELPERTGVVSTNVFAMALAVHQLTGGDLVSVLERLSRTIRDRILFVGRLRAATAASRATALLMLVVPPAVLVFFVLRDPGYLSALWASTWARNITLLAIALQVIGAVWVVRIMRDSART